MASGRSGAGMVDDGRRAQPAPLLFGRGEGWAEESLRFVVLHSQDQPLNRAPEHHAIGIHHQHISWGQPLNNNYRLGSSLLF